ncbi:MAG TPA: hypothetical protein VLU25_14825 [Acidobacteriota bacterium]|nr:hypothetical protein [Acidobacteriota bacterium]
MAVLLSVFCLWTANAQDDPAATLAAKIWEAIDSVQERRPQIVRVLNDNLDDIEEIIVHESGKQGLSSQQMTENFRWDYERKRIDKSTTSTASTSGSTSIVNKGSLPEVLSLAVEYGALERTASGSSVTFQLKPAGLWERIGKSPGKRTLEFFKRIGLGVTFDTDRGDMPGMLTDTGEQFSQFKLHFDIVNDRSPFKQKWDDKWREFAQTDLAKVAQASADLSDDYLAPDRTGYEQLLASIAAADNEQEVERALKNDVASFVREPNQTRSQLIATLITTQTEYQAEKEMLIEKIKKSPVFAFEYIFDRAPKNEAEAVMQQMSAMMAAGTVNQGQTTMPMPMGDPPSLSTIKLIYTGSATAIAPAQFAINFSLSFFNEDIADGDRLRDIRAAAQFDIPINDSNTLTFAGSYTSLRERPFGIPLTINGVEVGEPGDIGFFQTKWSIEIGDTGVSVPFSLTYANRTELIKEEDVRGSIGLSFDLDKFLLKP